MLFGLVAVALFEVLNYSFQCPRGHFCFSDGRTRRWPAARMFCFNAREGIFAFRTRQQWLVAAGEATRVSMPARAFLLFGPSISAPHSQSGCIRVSMPARAFLLFGPPRKRGDRVLHGGVSMPARAFLLFGLIAPEVATEIQTHFNAREGIFAFRTRRFDGKVVKVWINFNARGGIFAFRTTLAL